MSLEIRDVKTICTAPEGINLVVVKVLTNEPGLYGLGCATFAHRHLPVVSAVEDYLKPYLIGRNPQDIEDIWQSCMGMSYWRNGPVLNNALSGVDMALWDIKGKLAEMPLYQLFGGKCRDAVPCYAHAEGRDIQETIEQVGMLKEQGYRNVRAQVAGYGGNMSEPMGIKSSFSGSFYEPKQYMRSVVKLFEELRSTYGEELQICHDVHERLTPIDAINFAKEMQKFNLLFLEDPLSPEQSGWFSHLRNHVTVPIAMGELFNNPAEWTELIVNRMIDYIRIHISQIGGITPALKVARLCESFGVRTAWHGPPDMTPIGHAVNAHIDISIPNFGIQEWHAGNNNVFSSEKETNLLQEMFPGMPVVKDGNICLTESPGIGLDFDEELARKYPCSKEIVTWDWMLPRLPDGTAVRP